MDVLIPRLPRAVTSRPREISLVALMAVPTFRSPYAAEFFGAARPESSPLPWPSRSMKRWALRWSPCGANISALQDCLHGTDCWFAPPPQRNTPLHHLQSPGSSGSLLRGSLAITTTGLPPVSHQNLSRCTNGESDASLLDASQHQYHKSVLPDSECLRLPAWPRFFDPKSNDTPKFVTLVPFHAGRPKVTQVGKAKDGIAPRLLQVR